MRPSERDFLLMILAASAGSADGWSYFGFGHAFVANMTGNTVLVGMTVFRFNADLIHPALALACYCVGVALAAFLTRKVREGSQWPRAVSFTLLVEGILVAGCEAAWIHVFRASAGSYTAGAYALDPLLGVLAFAIGMQSGAMLQLKIPGIVTTYISGTWTSLMSGGVHLMTRGKRLPRRQNLAFEERLMMQGGVLAVYLLSVVVTGWLLRNVPASVGALPAAAVLTAAVYGLVRGSRVAA
ncbi:MAG: YoaK family protein [Terracidiphilus sp.]